MMRRQFSDGFRVWMTAFFILALASHFAHGSMTEVAMACDFGAICLLLLTPALFRIRRNRNSQIMIGASLVLLFGILSFAFFGAGKLTKIGIALSVFVVAVLENIAAQRIRIRAPGFKKALTLVTLSFLLFIWDESKLHCEPESWLQGHSFWHLGSAWAIAEYGRWRFGRET